MIEKITGMLLQLTVPMTMLLLLRIIAVPTLLIKLKKIQKIKAIVLTVIIYILTIMFLAMGVNALTVLLFVLLELGLLIYWVVKLVKITSEQKKEHKLTMIILMVLTGTPIAAAYKKEIVKDNFFMFLAEQAKNLVEQAKKFNMKYLVVMLYDVAAIAITYLLLIVWSLSSQKFAEGILSQTPSMGFSPEAAALLESQVQQAAGTLVKVLAAGIGVLLLWIIIYSILRTLIVNTILEKKNKSKLLLKNLLVTLVIVGSTFIVSLILIILTGLMGQLAILVGLLLVGLFIVLMIAVNFALQTRVIEKGTIRKAMKGLSLKKIILFLYVALLIITAFTFVAIPLILMPFTVQLILSSIMWLFILAYFKIYFVKLIK